MQKLKEFLYSVLAGICIGLGGIAYLSIENTVTGALFFTLGLFIIVTFGFFLFTGRVCYMFDNKPFYLIHLVIVWAGNFAGTAMVAYAFRITRFSHLAERARNIAEIKLSDDLLSIFILAVLCNILIFIAVDGFKRNPHNIGKYLGLFLGVAGFILCGFEHCVANMFYFSMANIWSGKALVYLIVMTAGNSAGGVLIPLARRAYGQKQKTAG